MLSRRFSWKRFELDEDLLDGVEIGTIGWEGQQCCFGGADRLAIGFSLVFAQVSLMKTGHRASM